MGLRDRGAAGRRGALAGGEGARSPGRVGLRLAALARDRRVLVVGFFVLAAFVASLPAVLQLPTDYIADGRVHGFGEPAAGDHLQSTYRFWLFGHRLEEGSVPWRDPYSFQPLVPPIAILSWWPFAPAFWPLEAALGPVVAWNLLLLATIALAGLATFAWLGRLGLGVPAALAGGLAFAIAPYRLAQSGGHLLGWAAVLLPVALWSFERSRAAGSRRSANLWGLVAAIALVSIPASGQVHLAIAALPFALAYALIRWNRRASAWLAGGTVAAIAVGLVIRETIIEGSSASGGRTLEQVELFQSDWLDLVSRFRREGLEQFAYVGWLLPLAAVVGVVILARRRQGWLAALVAVSIVVPLLIALGTSFPGYDVLREVIPPLRFPRVPGRLIPIADLALALGAAVAIAAALERARPSRRTLVGCVAVLLVAADLLVLPFGVNDAAPAAAAYRELATVPEGRIVDLPYFTPGTHLNSPYDAYAMQTPRERPQGYSSLAPLATYAPSTRLRRLGCGAWLPGDQTSLERLGVRYLLWHRGVYEQARIPSAWFGWWGLQLAGYRTRTRPAPGGPPVWLFARSTGLDPVAAPVAEPPRTSLVLCDGWVSFETSLPEAALWAYGDGTLELTLAATSSSPASLWVDGRRQLDVVLGPRTTVRLELAGARWHSIVLETPALAGGPAFRVRLAGFRLPA